MINLNKSMEDMLEEQKKIMVGQSVEAFNLGLKTADDLRTKAMEDIQDDMINDLVQAIIDTVEQNVTVEYDENEDGKFTYANVDTPNIREMLKDDIAEYILERRR